MTHAKDKIITRIQRLGAGSVFSAKDFLALGSRGTIDVTLSKLSAEGKIRRVTRGFYEYPKYSQLLGGPLSPDSDQVARAIARRFRWRILPTGAQAANMLGLSTQIPARIIYLTDGPTRRIKVGQQTLHFKHARPKQTAIEEPMSALVIQALRDLGKDAVGPAVIARLRAKLSPRHRHQLLRDARHASNWIFAAARQIAREAR